MSIPSVDGDYRYGPLASTKSEVRLVTILPQDPQAWQTTIDCTLHNVNLNDQPEFVALSYVWGSDHRPFKIRVDGKAFGVTANLFTALYYLRGDCPRTFWIDAVCIDQSSADERSEQVALMRKIFSYAMETCIWLGDFRFVPVQGSEDFLGHMKRTSEDSFLRHLMSDKRFVEGDAEYQNLDRILSCDWFTRIWVVQELACSKHASIRVGPAYLDWEILVSWTSRMEAQTNIQGSPAYSNIQDIGLKKMCTEARHAQIMRLEEQRQLFRKGTPSKLLCLIFELHGFHATNLLDTAYAVLGLSSGTIAIDYRISFDELLVRLSQHHNAVLEGPSLMHPHDLHDFKADFSWDPRSQSLRRHRYGAPPYAPHQKDWPIKSPLWGRCNKAGYIRAFLVASCASPLGEMHITWLNTEGSPQFVVLIEAGDHSFIPLECLEASESTRKSVEARLDDFLRECARMKSEDANRRWQHLVLPTFLPTPSDASSWFGDPQEVSPLWRFLLNAKGWTDPSLR